MEIERGYFYSILWDMNMRSILLKRLIFFVVFGLLFYVVVFIF